MNILKITAVVIFLITLTGCLSNDKGVQSEISTLQTISTTSQRVSNIDKTPQQTAATQSAGVTSYLNELQPTKSGVSRLKRVKSSLNELKNIPKSIKTMSRGENQLGTSGGTTPTQWTSASSSLESNAAQDNGVIGLLNEDQNVTIGISGLSKEGSGLYELNNTLSSMKPTEHQAGLYPFNSPPLMLVLLMLLPVLWLIFIKYIQPQLNSSKIT